MRTLLISDPGFAGKLMDKYSGEARRPAAFTDLTHLFPPMTEQEALPVSERIIDRLIERTSVVRVLMTENPAITVNAAAVIMAAGSADIGKSRIPMRIEAGITAAPKPLEQGTAWSHNKPGAVRVRYGQEAGRLLTGSPHKPGTARVHHGQEAAHPLPVRGTMAHLIHVLETVRSLYKPAALRVLYGLEAAHLLHVPEAARLLNMKETALEWNSSYKPRASKAALASRESGAARMIREQGAAQAFHVPLTYNVPVGMRASIISGEAQIQLSPVNGRERRNRTRNEGMRNTLSMFRSAHLTITPNPWGGMVTPIGIAGSLADRARTGIRGGISSVMRIRHGIGAEPAALPAAARDLHLQSSASWAETASAAGGAADRFKALPSPPSPDSKSIIIHSKQEPIGRIRLYDAASVGSFKRPVISSVAARAQFTMGSAAAAASSVYGGAASTSSSLSHRMAETPFMSAASALLATNQSAAAKAFGTAAGELEASHGRLRFQAARKPLSEAALVQFPSQAAPSRTAGGISTPSRFSRADRSYASIVNVGNLMNLAGRIGKPASVFMSAMNIFKALKQPESGGGSVELATRSIMMRTEPILTEYAGELRRSKEAPGNAGAGSIIEVVRHLRGQSRNHPISRIAANPEAGTLVSRRYGIASPTPEQTAASNSSVMLAFRANHGAGILNTGEPLIPTAAAGQVHRQRHIDAPLLHSATHEAAGNPAVPSSGSTSASQQTTNPAHANSQQQTASFSQAEVQRVTEQVYQLLEKKLKVAKERRGL